MTAMTQPMSVLTSHASQDWYTPPEIIEMVRVVLGVIDLDPASDQYPQSYIKAGSWWSRLTDSICPTLQRPWEFYSVFLNPPYGKGGDGSNQAAWSRKMAQEYESQHFQQGILLINSTHGYRWYEEIWTRYPVCLARERIRFIKPNGTRGGQAKRGQTFVYFGTDATKFVEVFSTIGRVIL